jgi:hypothetical protein
MNSVDSTTVLNGLIAMHNRTLPMYLANATRAWYSENDTHAREVLDAIAADQQATVERLGQLVMREGRPVEMGGFPIQFTSLHDLSLDYLIKKTIELQQRDISLIETAIQSLEDGSDEQALGEEALGAAKGHLESLNELSLNNT